jgi:hypothetical protein
MTSSKSSKAGARAPESARDDGGDGDADESEIGKTADSEVHCSCFSTKRAFFPPIKMRVDKKKNSEQRISD